MFFHVFKFCLFPSSSFFDIFSYLFFHVLDFCFFFSFVFRHVFIIVHVYMFFHFSFRSIFHSLPSPLSTCFFSFSFSFLAFVGSPPWGLRKIKFPHKQHAHFPTVFLPCVSLFRSFSFFFDCFLFLRFFCVCNFLGWGPGLLQGQVCVSQACLGWVCFPLCGAFSTTVAPKGPQPTQSNAFRVETPLFLLNFSFSVVSHFSMCSFFHISIFFVFFHFLHFPFILFSCFAKKCFHFLNFPMFLFFTFFLFLACLPFLSLFYFPFSFFS